MGTPVDNAVRARRAEASLSQAELARRVGVSRQALVAIEAGRQVPSTAIALSLARALQCTVEDLFSLTTGPLVRASLGTAGTGPRVVLGQVDGNWAAHPVTTGGGPADGVIVQGGRDANAVEVEPLRDLKECEQNVLIAGCAPLLGLLAGCLERRPGTTATWIPADSTRSLDLLAAGQVHVAGLHLAETSTSQGHRDLVRQRFPDRDMVIVGFASWRQGLAVRPGNPRRVRTVEDVLRADVRFVRRAAGSGAHRLLERLLTAGGRKAPSLGSSVEGSDHAEVARLIRLGVADTGLLFEGAAAAEGLDFIPLAEERFDLVLPRARLDQGPVARALGFLEHRSFRAQASPLPGYDLAITGQSETITA